MELNGIVESLENKSILVSGATGFLAKSTTTNTHLFLSFKGLHRVKQSLTESTLFASFHAVFVEKILRVQPNVKKLFLLLRAADSKSAKQRLNTEVIGKEVFKVLKQKCGTSLDSFILEKVTPVAGDISYENLGINDSDLREQIWSEVDVVLNFAATTNFEERYDDALGINTFGAKNVVDFAKKCKKLQMLVHVSTAYVCGERPGLILEKAFEMGETLNGTSGLDIEQELKMMEGKLYELRAMEATKEEEKTAMKELGLKRTIDSLIVGYGKGKLTSFLGSHESVMDLIPGDIVVNAIIVAMVTHANQPSENIYQVSSSLKNPMKAPMLRDLGYRYFSKKPWINKEGNPVIVNKAVLYTSMASFQNYMAIRYMIPLKGLELANTAFCQFFRGVYMDMNMKIKFVMRMVELYRPYVFFEGVFDDLNSERLRMAVRANEAEAKMFYFDPKCIDWEFYFMNIHLPGVVRYLFK
ncbi:hypothetical protein GIB67_012916 [Kingdonia uniflora]|uniref:Fatty acyl-CoA reductase n=1 Tax=Kingdonia uniflora TaxID=39325 RepID=A0A7J7NFK1_9MAGN|nr:hypothetical protein GIB67_012916 [Kingdonia uniflora]